MALFILFFLDMAKQLEFTKENQYKNCPAATKKEYNQASLSARLVGSSLPSPSHTPSPNAFLPVYPTETGLRV